MKTKLLFLSVTILALLFSSCKKEEKPRNFIIPIDFSDSRDSSVIKWYGQTVIASVLRKMGANDKLIILPIDRNSEVWGQEIFAIDFSKYEYGNEFAGLQSDDVEKNNFRDSVESARIQFNIKFSNAKLQREKFINQTDVFGALRQCQKYCSPKYRNIIVFLSDMQQRTEKGEVDFESNLNKETEAAQFLEKTERIDLKNIEIIVITGPQVNISSSKFGAIRKFWEEYFIRCEARLIDYSSGAVSKLEETVSDK